MRLAASGPDVPEALLREQRSGNALFVVGAGISSEAGLPLFGELTRRIYAAIGQDVPDGEHSLGDVIEREAWTNRQYDRVLGLLERRLVYRRRDWRQPTNVVRAVVPELLQAEPEQPLQVHRDLLDLSRGATGAPRILTTNFDTLLERAWRRTGATALPSSASAGMPPVGSPGFEGALHIHGRIADAELGLQETDLVLTAADFGEAYMRAGWASRAIYDLMRRFTLVFVGYAADDPPMRYMLEATEEGRLNFPDLRTPYAFAGDDQGDAGALRASWRAKGVQPIIYEASTGHQLLYDTVKEWARLVRDPLGWADERLARTMNRPFAEATDEERAGAAYLARDLTSVRSASRHTTDPAWIEALENGGAPLDSFDYLSWFDGRLSDPAAARYVAGVDGRHRLPIADAAHRLLLLPQEPLSEPFASFWKFYAFAHQARGDRYFYPRRVREPALADITKVVECLKPRLRITQRSSWPGDTSDRPAETIHDLAHFALKADEADWRGILKRWPSDARAELRLLNAADRALVEAYELADDAGLLDPGGDLGTFELSLVHDPEPGEALEEANDHGPNWKLNEPDGHNDRFAPLVRTLTGIWRRVADRTPATAASLALGWLERDGLLFKRLAAWAATVLPDPLMEGLDRYLSRVTPEQYWTLHLKPEIARFYCRHWPRLQPRTRRAIERAISKGPDPQRVSFAKTKVARAGVRDRRILRELNRIVSAGGHLSPHVEARRKRLSQAYPGMPSAVPQLAGLFSASWSGSGPSADLSALDEIGDMALLETVQRLEREAPIRQSDLWSVLVRRQPDRALRALELAAEQGVWPAERWQPLVSHMAYTADEPGRPEVNELRVIAHLKQAPKPLLVALAPTLALLFDYRFRNLGPGLLDRLLPLWDFILPIAAEHIEEDAATDRVDNLLSTPLALMTSALLHAQSEIAAQADNGWAPVVLPRVEAALAISGTAVHSARAALVDQLGFVHWIAPTWTEAHLIPHLLDRSDTGLELVCLFGRGRARSHPALFSRIKTAIIAALESETTPAWAREGLADAVFRASLRLIQGQAADLSFAEARRLLTRLPEGSLDSMAWALWRGLFDLAPGERAAFWQSSVRPFLQKIWPNDVTARTPEVSRRLVDIPAVTAESFADAVDVILGLIVPIEVSDLDMALGFDDERSVGKAEHPRAYLRLIANVIDPAARRPADLAPILEKLVEADPGVVLEHDYWRLRQTLKPA